MDLFGLERQLVLEPLVCLVVLKDLLNLEGPALLGHLSHLLAL